MSNFISEKTKDTVMKPIPKRNRFGYNSVFIMDKVPDKYIVEKEISLDFWNDISGWFHSNDKAGIEIADLRESDWEIPTDIKISDYKPTSDYIPVSVGDRIIDSDYNVYKIVGFINNNGSIDRYFDIK